MQIFIEIPRKLNDRQKQLLREFASTEDANVMPQRKGFMDKLKQVFTGDGEVESTYRRCQWSS